MDRLGQSWDRRQDTYRDGKEPITVQATVEISKPAQEVLDFVTSPQSSVLLDHHHILSIPVPGTPEGVGKQYCSLSRQLNGRMTATVTEVIEFEPPHRLGAKTLTGSSETLELMVVNPTTAGCTYSVSVEMRISYGTTRKVAPVAQKALDEIAAKVRSIVESGVRFETVNENLDLDADTGDSKADSITVENSP